MADEVDGLMARARGIRQGLETELSLAIDVMFPSSAVAGVLRDFQAVFPTVDLRLHVEALGAVAALVLDGKADLAIGGPDIIDHPGLECRGPAATVLILGLYYKTRAPRRPPRGPQAGSRSRLTWRRAPCRAARSTAR